MTMQPPPPEGVAIRAGRLFDPRTGTNLANQVIVIQGERIADVGPADRVKIPAGARVIDLSSATVLPGLIDRHVHLMQNQEPNDARALLVGQHYALADLYRRLYNAPGHEFALHLCDGRIAGRHQ